MIKPPARQFSFAFLGRAEAFQQMMDYAHSNFSHRDSSAKSQKTFVLVPGGPGVGKTRFAFELQHSLPSLPHPDPSFHAALQDPLYLSIDLNNGMQFNQLLDAHPLPDVRIGFRLAMAYFGGKMTLASISLSARDSFDTFDCASVLIKIITRERARRGAGATFCIIIHIDEYQIYIEKVASSLNYSLEKAREFFKDMLRSIGVFLVNSASNSGSVKNVFLLPVCTGTSANDVTFLPTEYHRVSIRLPPLSSDQAMQMAEERYHLQAAWARVKTSNHFVVALNDTGTLLGRSPFSSLPRIYPPICRVPRGSR